MLFLTKSKLNNPYFHILYWIFAALLLVLIFGHSWGSNLIAFYFISLLFPVVLGTSYFFNYFLVPRYLLTKKYLLFGLFFIYTLIVSLFLELLVLTFTFVYFLHFHFGKIPRNAADPLLLAIVMYLVVFSGSFLLMTKQLIDNNKELDVLKEDKEKMQKPFLQIISERKTVRIPYNDILFIESLSDYIKICTLSNNNIVSKEKISHIEKKLPDIFLRIHRSFIVNIEKISRFNYNEVEIMDTVLNVGRSYKRSVMERLKRKGNR